MLSFFLLITLIGFTVVSLSSYISNSTLTLNLPDVHSLSDNFPAYSWSCLSASYQTCLPAFDLPSLPQSSTVLMWVVFLTFWYLDLVLSLTLCSLPLALWTPGSQVFGFVSVSGDIFWISGTFSGSLSAHFGLGPFSDCGVFDSGFWILCAIIWRGFVDCEPLNCSLKGILILRKSDLSLTVFGACIKALFIHYFHYFPHPCYMCESVLLVWLFCGLRLSPQSLSQLPPFLRPHSRRWLWLQQNNLEHCHHCKKQWSARVL